MMYGQKNIKLREPNCSARTDGQTQTDMTKLTVAFRNFANEPKNVQYFVNCNFLCSSSI